MSVNSETMTSTSVDFTITMNGKRNVHIIRASNKDPIKQSQQVSPILSCSSAPARGPTKESKAISYGCHASAVPNKAIAPGFSRLAVQTPRQIKLLGSGAANLA